MVMAGAPCYELVKEREGAPLFLPHRSCPFSLIFPSFFVSALTQRPGQQEVTTFLTQGDIGA
jgi:hypothetical protein